MSFSVLSASVTYLSFFEILQILNSLKKLLKTNLRMIYLLHLLIFSMYNELSTIIKRKLMNIHYTQQLGNKILFMTVILKVLIKYFLFLIINIIFIFNKQ